MTVKVAGLWELGWSAPLTEHDWWDMVMRDFAVDEHYMTPISGIHREQVTEVANLEDAINANPDLTVVFIDERAEVELQDFVHPENALYILGKVTYSGLLAHKRDGDLSVKIQTNMNQGLLWPHQAAAIVLYDRGVKNSWQ